MTEKIDRSYLVIFFFDPLSFKGNLKNIFVYIVKAAITTIAPGLTEDLSSGQAPTAVKLSKLSTALSSFSPLDSPVKSHSNKSVKSVLASSQEAVTESLNNQDNPAPLLFLVDDADLLQLTEVDQISTSKLANLITDLKVNLSL